MSALVSLHIGQAGVQVGKKVWTQLSAEHGINEVGQIDPENERMKHDYCFHESSTGTWGARGLFIDGDPSTIDESILNGRHKKMFLEENCVKGTRGAANCYSLGRYGIFKELMKQMYVVLRRMTESCDSVGSFAIHHSIGGGTGSGVCTKVLEFLSDAVPNTQKFLYSIFPSPVVDPCPVSNYNAIISVAETKNIHEMRLIYDNESLAKEISPVLLNSYACTFKHTNHLIATILSRLTAGDRYLQHGALNVNRLATNLIPFPAYKMISSAYVLLESNYGQMIQTNHSITAEAFLNNHELCNFNIFKGSYFSSCLQYCVNELNLHDILNAAACVRNEFAVPFVSWVPSAFCLGHVTTKFKRDYDDCWYSIPDCTLLKLCNHSEISGAVEKMTDVFSKMYRQRMYTYWYVAEGMTEAEFDDCLESARSMIRAMRKYSGEEEPEYLE